MLYDWHRRPQSCLGSDGNPGKRPCFLPASRGYCAPWRDDSVPLFACPSSSCSCCSGSCRDGGMVVIVVVWYRGVFPVVVQRLCFATVLRSHVCFSCHLIPTRQRSDRSFRNHAAYRGRIDLGILPFVAVTGFSKRRRAAKHQCR